MPPSNKRVCPCDLSLNNFVALGVRLSLNVVCGQLVVHVACSCGLGFKNYRKNEFEMNFIHTL